LQEITGDTQYLHKAKKWTLYVQTHFVDEEQTFYYFTPAYQKDLVIRKKENYDGAQPSGNAMMCYNLLYLSNMFSIPEWSLQARKMVFTMRKMILQYPASFSVWAQSFTILHLGFVELVNVGSKAKDLQLSVLKPFLPHRMTVFTNNLDAALSLTSFKQTIDNQYYICINSTCLPPFSNMKDFLTYINQLNY
jgi:hypothetical protein